MKTVLIDARSAIQGSNESVDVRSGIDQVRRDPQRVEWRREGTNHDVMISSELPLHVAGVAFLQPDREERRRQRGLARRAPCETWRRVHAIAEPAGDLQQARLFGAFAKPLLEC